MNTIKDTESRKDGKRSRDVESVLPGYPSYPAGDDIYNRYREDREVDPEEISEPGDLVATSATHKARNIAGDAPGSDLDIPGSELDDDMEAIGSEDEENNYYSLGGENHEDLEERKGELGFRI